MQNNKSTLYVLEFDSSVAKSAKISTILYHFVPKNLKNIDVLAVLPWLYESILKDRNWASFQFERG